LTYRQNNGILGVQIEALGKDTVKPR